MTAIVYVTNYISFITDISGVVLRAIYEVLHASQKRPNFGNAIIFSRYVPRWRDYIFVIRIVPARS